MGQEASVPLDEATLEEQAKAPPTASNGSNGGPVPVAAGSLTLQGTTPRNSQQNLNGGGGSNHGGGGGGSNHHHTPTRPVAAAAAARVMNAFSRHKDHHHHHGHHQHHQHQHHQQYDQDYMYESREAARAAAAGGMFYQGGNSAGTEEDVMNHHAMPPPPPPPSLSRPASSRQPPPPPINSAVIASDYPDSNTPTPSNIYHTDGVYHTDSDLSSSRVSAKSSLSYNSKSVQSSAAMSNPGASVASSKQQLPTSPSGSGPQVGVMYEKTPSKRGGGFLAGRAQARGAALVNTMRNLTLGGGSRGNNKKDPATDWEKQWDEDESDDGEDDENEGGVDADVADQYSQAQHGSHPQHNQPQQQQQHQPDYPPIAHSTSQSMSTEVSHKQHQQFLQQQQQQQQQHGYTGGPQPTAALRPNNKPHYSTVHPTVQTDTASTQPGAEPPDFLTPAVSDDELEWDTGATSPTDGGMKPGTNMFPMLRVLGKGSFGKVVLVQKKFGKEIGQLFAMKILRKTHLVRKRQIERTRTERKVLSVVNHPFIMKLHYAFQTDDKLYLVLDYCPGGELFFHLSRFRRFPERVARFFSAELLLAIGHLHKRGIIYRDLKPENVLLDADGHIKLGDFGLAKAGISHPYQGAISMCGTPEYMAPEVLSQQGHGFGVDYWGLGMLVYEMMTGLPPWYTTDRAKLFRRLKSAPLDIPAYFSDAAADFTSQLLERNPRRRLGVMGIRPAMEHKFFNLINWKHLYARKTEPPVKPCEAWKATSKLKEEVANTGNDLNNNELDLATGNFDATFLRMPVESEDHTVHQHNEDATENSEGIEEELNPETFVGFSFDSKDREAADEAYQISRRQARQQQQQNLQYSASTMSPQP